MYKTVGIREILENLIRLTKSHLEGIPNQANLKDAYRKFLREAQPKVPHSETIHLTFKSQKNDVAPLLEIFKEDSVLDDFEEVFDVSGDHLSEDTILRVQLALQKIKEIQPSFANVIDLVIHTIFSFPSKLAGGGSTSAAIGCIWVDLRSHWHEQDVLEFLVHETTHNLVFIDELCYSHYSSYAEIAKSENFARSAILNKPRPLDKVFHSILVSTEVLLFRQDHFGHPDNPCLHPPTDILLDQTLRSIDSIKEVDKFLTSRAKSLLQRCEERLRTIEMASGVSGF